MIIQGIEISEEVFTTKFACNYLACKGWCCHGGKAGEYEGALVTDDEADSIIEFKDALKELVENDAKEDAEEPVYHYENEPETNYISITPKGKCIYCHLEKGGCVLKMQTDVPYPRHCGLYPLFLDESGKRPVLKVEDFYGEICEPARIKGKKENIFLVDFSKDSLIREFGLSFYLELKKNLR